MLEFPTWFPATYLPSAGFRLEGTDIDCVNDDNYQSSMFFKTVQGSLNLNPGFSTSSVLGIGSTTEAWGGHNNYRGGLWTDPEGVLIPGSITQAKHTFQTLSVDAVHRGSGQHILTHFSSWNHGMGDSAVLGLRNTYWGGPVYGDEGQGFTLVSGLEQGKDRFVGTVQGPGSIGQPSVLRSALDTTTTQVITASKDVQTVTVASSTGAVVNDWVVVEHMPNDGAPVLEPVKITAVGTGTISGIFRNNHPSGVKVRPAACIAIDLAQTFGQDRVIVNMTTGTTYTTGQITSAEGAALIGTGGMTWSNGMVGGDADNIGAICIETDTYTGPPYFSVGNPLESWHQITAIVNPTRMVIHSFSCAGDTSYKGRAAFPSNYVIRPAARMLRYDICKDGFYRAICEYSAHTWAEGHQVECVICPYPDVTGFQFRLGQWTPNGGNSRCFLDVINTGARMFQQGIILRAAMPNVGGVPAARVDTFAWNEGLYIHAAKTGIYLSSGALTGMSRAIYMHSETDDNGTKIEFGGLAHIKANYANQGLEIRGSGYSPTGAMLSFIPETQTSEVHSRLNFTGSLRLAGWLDIPPVVAPGGIPTLPPAAPTYARIYVEPVGGTKMRLMARFPTGAAVQIAIEP